MDRKQELIRKLRKDDLIRKLEAADASVETPKESAGSALFQSLGDPFGIPSKIGTYTGAGIEQVVEAFGGEGQIPGEQTYSEAREALEKQRIADIQRREQEYPVISAIGEGVSEGLVTAPIAPVRAATTLGKLGAAAVNVGTAAGLTATGQAMRDREVLPATTTAAGIAAGLEALPVVGKGVSAVGKGIKKAADYTGLTEMVSPVGEKIVKAAEFPFKLPSKLLGATEESIEAYIKNPELINPKYKTAVKYSEEVKNLSDFGKELRQRVDNSELFLRQSERALDDAAAAGKTNLDDLRNNIKIAKDARDQAVDEYKRNITKQEVALKQQEFELQKMVKQESRKVKDEVAALKDTQRETIEQSKKQLENPTDRDIAIVAKELDNLRATTSEYAGKQISSLRAKGVDTIIDTTPMFARMDEMVKSLKIKGPGGELVPTDKSEALEAFINKHEDLIGELDATEVLKLRQQAQAAISWGGPQGKYVSPAERELKLFASDLNNALDEKFVNHGNIRETLKTLTQLQDEAGKVIGKDISQALGKITQYKKSKTFQKLASRKGADPEFLDVINKYRGLQEQINQMKKAPVVDRTALDAAEKELTSIKTRLFEGSLEKKLEIRPQFPEDVAVTKAERELETAGEAFARQQSELERNVALSKSQVDWTKAKAKQLGFTGDELSAPTKKSESLIQQMFNKEPGGIAVREQIGDISEEMRDLGLPGRLENLKAQQELFGTIPGLRTGTSWVANLVQLVKAFPGSQTIPLGVIRAGRKLANTKYQAILENAAKASGARSVAATHFLLMSNYPDYRKIIKESEEENNEE